MGKVKKYTVTGKGFWFKVNKDDKKYTKLEAGDTVELTEERAKKLRERLASFAKPEEPEVPEKK